MIKSPTQTKQQELWKLKSNLNAKCTLWLGTETWTSYVQVSMNHHTVGADITAHRADTLNLPRNWTIIGTEPAPLSLLVLKPMTGITLFSVCDIQICGCVKQHDLYSYRHIVWMWYGMGWNDMVWYQPYQAPVVFLMYIWFYPSLRCLGKVQLRTFAYPAFGKHLVCPLVGLHLEEEFTGSEGEHAAVFQRDC